MDKLNEEQKALIKKLALLNAVKHEGKANPGSIVGGVLGDFPELKKDMKNLMSEINDSLKEINSLSLEEQTNELLKLDKHALDKKEHVVDIFAFLKIKEGEKVITAFPPGPEKYPHIGHAKAILLNYLLAKKFNGKFILRFEDTNPELVKKEFYKIMEDDFKWLGINWDRLECASDHMDLYYKHCKDLFNSDKAYVCTCKQEEIKKSRETGEACSCRSRSNNLELWDGMKNMTPGSAVVRLKIDLSHKNTTMRDPVIFRISDAEHARQEKKYSVWPNYDFQNAIMDGYLGITHRLRSKEFEMRNELQRYIQKLLGYKETNIYEFARFNLKGVESSGRIIREKIENKELIGWDDPSLTTIAALRRRGFQPKAIEEFVVSTGITKSESTLTWDDLIIHNKRLLDKKAERYFFVAEPVEIKIKNSPKKEFELKVNPANEKRERKFSTDENFLIAKNDFDSLKKDSLYRLMECLNFKNLEFVDNEIETYKKEGKGILHYLPKNANNIPVKILMPNNKLIEGLAEENIKNLKQGQVIQFERFGFVRLDDKKSNFFWFTH